MEFKHRQNLSVVTETRQGFRKGVWEVGNDWKGAEENFGGMEIVLFFVLCGIYTTETIPKSKTREYTKFIVALFVILKILETTQKFLI